MPVTTETIEIKKEADVGTIVLTRKGDGSFEFEDAAGNVIRSHSNVFMERLWKMLKTNT